VARWTVSDHAPIGDYNRGWLDGAEAEGDRREARAKAEADEKRRYGGAQVVLEESERQMALLAFAVLSLENPGFDYMLNEMAKRIDNVDNGRARMYDEFRMFRKKE